MVTAIILMNVEKSMINQVADRLADMDGVSEVYSVTGRYDLVVTVHIGSNEQFSQLVTKRILAIDSIIETEAMLAFKVYSRHDLDSMFSIGFEKK